MRVALQKKFRGLLLFGTLTLIQAVSCWALPKMPLVLKEEQTAYTLDSAHFLALDSIGPGLFTEASEPDRQLYFTNTHPEKSYWYCFTLQNNLDEAKDWLLVSYNYGIDEIDVWSDYKSGPQQFRHTTGVYDRKFGHKQPVFVFHFLPGESKTLYVRIKNEFSYKHVFAVFSYSEFFVHFFHEYLFYGLFYGFMLFVIVYSTFNAVILKDKIVGLYALFITCQVLHMTFRDGTGLFLVPNFPEYSDVIKNLMRYAFSIFLLLYMVAFLKISPRTLLFKSACFLMVIRTVFLAFLTHDPHNVVYHVELFLVLYCTSISIYTYRKGVQEAKYMSIGLSLLSIFYGVYYLSMFIFPTWNRIGFFGLYFGVVGESIFMTLALTNRFRRAQLDNFKKEQVNKELERLVEERTATIREQHQALEERSDELNLFLYSISHDFKGPLKTIEGLCNMGLLDAKADHLRIYHLIAQRLKHLESNINDLKQVSTIKNGPDTKEKVDFEALHAEMMERYKEFPGFRETNIHLNLMFQDCYQGDFFSIRCIYQHLFENAIKFRDPDKPSFLIITLRKVAEHIELVFQDNGEGISSNSLPHVFQMFYRASENAREDTGMGLFIAKLAAEKLKGTLTAESIRGEGSTFSVVFPYA